VSGNLKATSEKAQAGTGSAGVIEQGACARETQEPGRPRRRRHRAVRPSEGNGAESEVVGESERCTVPEKRGNLTEGTPWRESGAGVRTRLEERWERHRAHKLSPRNSSG
jgi:hypothetical protein